MSTDLDGPSVEGSDNEFEKFRITSPSTNGVITTPGVLISGRGGLPFSIHVRKINLDGTQTLLGIAYPQPTPGGPWSIGSVPFVDGEHKIIAVMIGITGDEVPTEPVTFQVKVPSLAVPDISTPESGVTYDARIWVSGTKGVRRALIEIFQDLTENRIGFVTVDSNDGTWGTYVNFPVGPFSIVVRQTLSNRPSASSSDRAFKVRPPAFTAVNVEYLTETSVKFSGVGHTGATVEITSGPGGPTLGPVTVVNNAWSVEATNWPPGQYSFSATQKVSDNDLGWIVSTPYAFTFTWALHGPADVRHTGDYTPVFFGSGYNGATVELFNPDRVSRVAPDALVIGGGWSSQASAVWGPTLKREVHLRQRLGQVVSDGWVVLQVTIAPLAPVITRMIDNETTPIFEGTCWPVAQVNLKFSDDPTVYPAVVQQGRGTWTYSRPTPFEIDITHTVTVTQRFADQDSPPATRSFSVNRKLPTPVFTAPEFNEEVGRDLLVEGTEGVAGGQVQLWDAQFDPHLLGTSAILSMDGPWSVELKGLKFREYRIYAVQVMGSRASEPTDTHVFEVVVLPPKIEVPAPGGAIARTAIISGAGMPGARVDVYLEGVAEPLLSGLWVNPASHWSSEAVTLEIGHKTLWARQTFETRPSKDSPRQAFRVVPAKPSIETPVAVERVGRQVVVSGFGYAGDEVAVALSDEPQTVLGRASVRPDRTWSVAVELDRPDGSCSLMAVQSRGEFNSDPSEERPVVLGAYVPSVDVPAAGRWVSDPVEFAGKGQTGVGVLVSWYNPERVLAKEIVVTDEGWKGQSSLRLLPGGHWVRFKQLIHRDDVLWTYSDWADSARFEVVSSPSGSKS
jgi:hypothetical protein